MSVFKCRNQFHGFRQIDNIRAAFPDAVIIDEAYTGTTMTRPKWEKLMQTLRAGDTVVFDEVSRMARCAEEGFQTYRELYDKGVNLAFLKESTLNTDNFRDTAQVAMTGTDVDLILDGVNRYLMVLAENQIKTAFQTAQHEVDFLHKRTSEGVRRAQAEGKQVGLVKGSKLTTKKSQAAKEVILKHSRDFGGTLADAEVIKLADVSRNSYYKYKQDLRVRKEIFDMRFDVVKEFFKREGISLVSLDNNSDYDGYYNLVKDGEIVNTMKFDNILDNVVTAEEGVYYLPATPEYIGACEKDGKTVCISIWECCRVAHEEGIPFDEFMDNMRIATEEEVYDFDVVR